MKVKSAVFFLWLSLFLVIFVSGCISLPQNQQYSDLEKRVTKMEKRADKIEKDDVKLEDKLVTTNSSISLKNKTEGIGVSQQLIRFPSNEDIQIALKNAGLYDGNIDGKIGTKTRNAIKEFQKQNDLEIDGVVGRNTWEVLSKYYDMPKDDVSDPEVKIAEEENKEEATVTPEIGD